MKIGTQKQRGKLYCFFPTPMLSQNFTPAVPAWNLGVTCNNKKNFRQHISQTCHCCFYDICDLRCIRLYMSSSVAKTIATALVSNILDYCNFRFHNIALKDILKLQHVQHCLLRVVTQSPCFSHSDHFLNRCIGYLSDITLFLRFAQLHFHPSSQHIYMHCSLL